MAARKGNPYDEYELLGDLGDGSFGSVQKGIGKKDGMVVAIKRIKKKYSTLQEVTALREYRAFRLLASSLHPNLCSLRETFLNPQTKEFFFIMEYCEGGNLYQFMKERREMRARGAPGGGVSARECWEVGIQILEGLRHMHSCGLFHRDMKPENVLISYTDSEITEQSDSQPVARKLLLKIADFGLAREVKSKPPYTEYVSTRWYRAPEVLLRSRDYGPAVDLWAVGVILAELVTLRPLFPGQSEVDQVWRICEVLGSPGYFSSGVGSNSVSKRGSWGGTAKQSLGMDVPGLPHSVGTSPESRKIIDAILSGNVPDVIGGGDWREGVKLAGKIGFAFPKMPPKPLQSLLPSASPSLVELLANLLRYDPKQRPTAKMAMQFPYFHEDPEPKPAEKRESLDVLLGQLRNVGSNTKLPLITSPTSPRPVRSSLDILSTDPEKENRRWSYQDQFQHRRESSMSSFETSNSSVIGRSQGRKRRSQLVSVFASEESSQGSDSTRPSLEDLGGRLGVGDSLPNIPITSPMLAPLWSTDDVVMTEVDNNQVNQVSQQYESQRGSILDEVVREFAVERRGTEDAKADEEDEDKKDEENDDDDGGDDDDDDDDDDEDDDNDEGASFEDIPTSLIKLPRLSSFFRLTHQPLVEDDRTDWLLREIDECVRAGGAYNGERLWTSTGPGDQRSDGTFGDAQHEPKPETQNRISIMVDTSGKVTVVSEDDTVIDVDQYQGSDDKALIPEITKEIKDSVAYSQDITKPSMLGSAIASSSAMLLSTSAPTSFYSTFKKSDQSKKKPAQKPAPQIGFDIGQPPSQRKRLLSFTSRQPSPISHSPVPPLPVKLTTPNFHTSAPSSKSTPTSRQGRSSRPSTSAQRGLVGIFGMVLKSTDGLISSSTGSYSARKSEDASPRKTTMPWPRSRHASPTRHERKEPSLSIGTGTAFSVIRRGSECATESITSPKTDWNSSSSTKYNTVSSRTSISTDATSTMTHYGAHLNTWAKQASATGTASPSGSHSIELYRAVHEAIGAVAQSPSTITTTTTLAPLMQVTPPSFPPPRSSSLPRGRPRFPEVDKQSSASSLVTGGVLNGFKSSPALSRSTDASPNTGHDVTPRKEKRRSGGRWFGKFHWHGKNDSSVPVEATEERGRMM